MEKFARKKLECEATPNIYVSFLQNYLHYSQKSYTFVPCLEDVIGK